MIWQPIETAPKDEVILAYYPGRGVSISWLQDGKWLDQTIAEYARYDSDPEPTHWMPLPEPPEQN